MTRNLAPARLMPVSEALMRLLAGRSALVPTVVPVEEALGGVLAETLRAGAAVPSASLAQRDGIAVASGDLVGASPYAPALLGAMPARVRAGDALPAGSDAVLPAGAASGLEPMIEIGQSAYPGENVTLAGADFAAGACIAGEGETLTASMLLALHLAGIREVAVRRPRIRFETGPMAPTDSPHLRWLRSALQAAGCVEFDGEEADLHLAFSSDDERDTGAGLALRPGHGATVLSENGMSPVLRLPARFDGVVACHYALLLPVLAHLTRRALHFEVRPLMRKITSTIGFSDLALLRRVAEGYEPLAVGQVTLSALLASDAVAVIPPDSEGAAAGTPLSAVPINKPLTPLDT